MKQGDTALAVTRDELLGKLDTTPQFDLVVVGGGIHGAVAAKIAALNGYRTALFERRDYASATSSRSSKLAHGGLRYLELLDFKQVFEGIKAREDLFESVPHMVKPAPFLIPIPVHKQLFKFKLKAGLCLYDLLVRNQDRKHRWIPARELPPELFAEQQSYLLGCFQYTDGILDDSRLVIENILQARKSGTLCLNYCGVREISFSSEGARLLLNDELSSRTFEVRTKVVLNCSGPWAPELSGGVLQGTVVYSRGSHVLFNVPWEHPCLFLPMRGKARYYFVLPHPGGTLVGTTEREVSHLENDPMPAADEIQEIYERLAKDLPHANLNASTAHYCFAGVRTLPLRKPGTMSAQLSRLHLWRSEGRMLTLLGGKYTTATWTAYEGVKHAAELAKLPPPSSQVNIHAVAGSYKSTEHSNLCANLQQHFGISNKEAEQIIRLYGGRSRDLLSFAHAGDQTSQAVCAQASLSLQSEQAETLEDLTRRRLNLEYLPGNGETHLESLVTLLNKERPRGDTTGQVQSFHARIQRIKNLLRRSH